MSRVFIFGISGYIGSHVAQAFRREGYEVTGLTRTEEKAKVLRGHEINAIVGKSQDSKNWEAAVESADIVIEAMADYQDHQASVNLQKILERIVKQKPGKFVIYTSGVWGYGSNSKVVDENDKLNPPTLVKTRENIEKAYLELGAVVVRPACVYGKQGSLTATWIAALKGGKAEFPGSGNHYWTMVHVNDLADAYVKLAQKRDAVKGQCFNLSSHNLKVKDCIQAVASVLGYKGEIKFHAPADPFSECLALDLKVNSQKAKSILGWNPKHPNFIEGVEQYVRAIEAHQ